MFIGFILLVRRAQIPEEVDAGNASQSGNAECIGSRCFVVLDRLMEATREIFELCQDSSIRSAVKVIPFFPNVAALFRCSLLNGKVTIESISGDLRAKV